MAKPLAICVPSDDCVVTVSGTAYTPHEGESVWLLPGQSVGDVAVLARFNRIQAEVEALRGDADEAARSTELYDAVLSDLCAFLARRMVRWDWTDLAGRPLPPLDGTPAPLQALETEELFWLLQAARGQNATTEKNDSRPSPITSSATARPPSLMSSGEGRSRTRAS